MYRHVIGRSANGREIYVDLVASAAGSYISRRPYLISHIRGVLAGMKLTDPTMTVEHDMGEVIGNTDFIDTTDKDIIFYAQPIKKNVYWRYAKNRYPSPSRHLTVLLRRDSGGDYEVTDTWIGPCVPPFPGDDNATADSLKYWQTHAVAQDAQGIQTKTITRTCPY